MTLESLILLSLIMLAVVLVNCYFWFNRAQYIKVDNERTGVIVATLLDLPPEQLNKIYNEVQEGVYRDV